jgi:hypothetical protein
MKNIVDSGNEQVDIIITMVGVIGTSLPYSELHEYKRGTQNLVLHFLSFVG